MSNLLFLSLEDTVKCLNYFGTKNLAEKIKAAFLHYHNKKIIQPHKIILKDEEYPTAHINIMPCIVNDLPNKHIYSIKIIGSEVENVAKGLPRASGLVILFDQETKIPFCIMDVQAISALRTGIVSRVAADYILPKTKLQQVTLIGSGINMRTQIVALEDRLRQAEVIYVYSRGNSKNVFAAEMSEQLNLNIQAIDSLDQHLPNSDLIVTCTSSYGPAWITNEMIGKAKTIIDIGGVDMQSSVVGSMDKVIVDSWEDTKERGTFPVTMPYFENKMKDEDYINLSEIIAGEKIGRTNDAERIYFSPIGMAFYDAVIAEHIHEYAQQQSLGSNLALWKDSKWV